MTEMMEKLIELYRKMDVRLRRVSVFIIAASLFIGTMSLMTFPATAVSRNEGEDIPGFVFGEEEVSEPAEEEENPEETAEEPSEEEGIVLQEEEGEEPVLAEEEPQVVAEEAVTEEAEEPEEESDPYADVETAADWEKLFRDVELTGVWADDLLELAELQIGYRESKKNFILDEDHKKHGYTRYGAWYGDPYADWNSLFILFNLYYTGVTVDQFPYKADPAKWVEELKENELFAEAEEYIPVKGDLVFADTDDDDEADYAAIVKEVEYKDGRPDKLTVIEGDAGNEVKKSTYEFYDPSILGFAKLPENPDLAEEEKELAVYTLTGSANRVDVTVEYEEGALPEGTTMEVKTVGDRSVIDAISDTVNNEENKAVVRVQAVDIIFRDSDGNEVEPAKPVKVTMKSNSVPQKAEEKPVIVHVDDQEGPKVVETSPEETKKEEVKFEAGSFSVYAIVYTLETVYKTYDGESYKITVGYTAEANLPEDAALSVSELLPENAGYGDYLLASIAALELEEEADVKARVFDISIVNGEGKKIEPKAPVQTEIRLLNQDGEEDEITEASAEESGSFGVVHFGDQPTVLDVEAFREDGAQVITFETDGFSVYVVIDTEPDPIDNEMDYISKLDPLTYAIVAGRLSNGRQVAMQHDFSETLVNRENAFYYTYDVGNPELWTFVPAGNNQYYIKEGGNYIAVGDETRYSNECYYLKSVNNQNDAAKFYVHQENNGEYYIETTGPNNARVFLNKTPNNDNYNSDFQFWRMGNPGAYATDEGNRFYLCTAKEVMDQIMDARSYAIIGAAQFNGADGAMNSTFGHTDVIRKGTVSYIGKADEWSFMPLPDGSYLIKQADGDQFVAINFNQGGDGGGTNNLQLVNQNNATRWFITYDNDGAVRIYSPGEGNNKYYINKKNNNDGYQVWSTNGNGGDGSKLYLCKTSDVYAIIGYDKFNGADGAMNNTFGHDDVVRNDAATYTGTADEWAFIELEDGSYLIKQANGDRFINIDMTAGDGPNTQNLKLVNQSEAMHWFIAYDGDGAVRIYSPIPGTNERYYINKKNNNEGYQAWRTDTNGYNGSKLYLCKATDAVFGNFTYAIIPNGKFGDNYGAITLEGNNGIAAHQNVDSPTTSTYTRAGGKATEWTFVLRPDGKYMIKKSDTEQYIGYNDFVDGNENLRWLAVKGYGDAAAFTMEPNGDLYHFYTEIGNDKWYLNRTDRGDNGGLWLWKGVDGGCDLRLATYMDTGVTDNLDGRKFVIVNTTTKNALTSTPIDKGNGNIRLDKTRVYINNDNYENSNYTIVSGGTFEEDGVNISENTYATLVEWTFTKVPNGAANEYYVTTPDGKYLNIEGHEKLSVANNPTSVFVETDGSGKARIYKVIGGTKYYLRDAAGGKIGPVGNRNGICAWDGTNDDMDWFTFCEAEKIDDDHNYEPAKISVQDFVDGQEVVIYKTIYNETTKAYEDYVITGDPNGNMAKAYDKGDYIAFRSVDNPKWTVKYGIDPETGLPNGYFYFYQEVVDEEGVKTYNYLFPQSGTIIANSTVAPEDSLKVTLSGRYSGQYTSTIEAKDEEQIAFYGYQIQQTVSADDKVSTTLIPGTGMKSQEFSFASFVEDYAGTPINQQDICAKDGETTINNEVIVYQTVHNNVTGEDELYAIDGNGNLVRAYKESGKIVTHSAENVIWNVTKDENNNYVFSQTTTNPDLITTTTKYLYPNADGTVKISDTPLKVNLVVVEDGSSHINKEDKQEAKIQAGTSQESLGLDVVQDYGVMLLKTGTGDDSQYFSFASAKHVDPQENTLHTVPTVDSRSHGITIKMFDFNGDINEGYTPRYDTQDPVVGGDNYQGGNHYNNSGLASATLNGEGYPTFAGGHTLKELFNEEPPAGQNHVLYRGEANHLFLQSVYDDTGYYEYSSFNNFAYFNYDPTSEASDFTVYQELGIAGNDNNDYFHKRGNFLPYNDLDPNKPASNINLYDGDGNPLDPEDPTMAGVLYQIKDVDTSLYPAGQFDNHDLHPDYYFGMSMAFDFVQPKNGLIKGNPMVFEFNGDDDMWVYVDGVKVLDIGGVHDALPGTINFKTGEITYGANAPGENILPRWLGDCFKAAGKLPNGDPWTDAGALKYFEYSDGHYKNFLDYTAHHVDMFYMEHGAGASNLEIRFNLPVIEPGSFTVEKQLDESTQAQYGDVYFLYQAFRVDSETANTALNPNMKGLSVVYEGTSDPVPFYNNLTVGGTTYNNVFLLKQGQAATFKGVDKNASGETIDPALEDESTYWVREVGAVINAQLNGTQFGSNCTFVPINATEDGRKYFGQPIVNETPPRIVDNYYTSGVDSIRHRARVSYENFVYPNTQELRITKKPNDRDTWSVAASEFDESTFNFRVKLEDNSGNLTPYFKGPYYLIKVDPDKDDVYYHYVGGELIPQTEKPYVPAGVSEPDGTIKGVPFGYTVSIKGLLPGTHFLVEEIDNPDKWWFARKDLETGTYDASLDYLSGADGRIKIEPEATGERKNAHEIIYNKSVNVDIYKVDINKDDSTDTYPSLKGAKFELRKIDPKDLHYLDERAIEALYTPDGDKARTSTNDDGKASFVKLGAGYYEIVETQTPDGYIRLNSGKFYIKVENRVVENRVVEYGVVSLVQPRKRENVPETDPKKYEWDVIEASTELNANGLMYTAAIDGTEDATYKDAKPASVTVGNTPGAELPLTGGIGTTVFTALGMILIAGAGFLLWRRRPV